jgi:hypothetical protein
VWIDGKETKAIVQQVASHADEEKRSFFLISPASSQVEYCHSEGIATEHPKMVIPSRSIDKP